MAAKKKKKAKDEGGLHVAIIIGENKKSNGGPRDVARQGMSAGGKPEFMGNAYPSADTDRVSRGGGIAVTGVKFRGIK